MKKYIVFISFLVAGFGFWSCERDLESENVSNGIVNYPNIVIAGDQYMSIPVGQAYQDKGAKAYSGTTEITSSMTTEGSVDVNTPGVYTITYSVTNDENRSLTKVRYVGVVTPAAAAMDISGTYLRTGSDGNTSRTINVIKKDYPGMYTNDNPGGMRRNVETDGAYFVTIYMWQVDATKIASAGQSTALGDFSITSGTVSATSPTTISWKVSNQYFGTGVRTFVKQ